MLHIGGLPQAILVCSCPVLNSRWPVGVEHTIWIGRVALWSKGGSRGGGVSGTANGPPLVTKK